MRVLHVAQGAPGGIGRVEQLLAAVWLRDQRVSVTTIRRMAYPGYLESPAATSQQVGLPRWVITILLSLLRHRPDVLILNHLNLSPVAVAYRLLRPRGRLVAWAYGMEAWERPSRWQRLGLRLVDQVWSISDYTARRFTAVAGFPPERVVLVPLALTPERAAALSRKHETAANNNCDVLTVTRLSVRHGQGKGVDHLIEAMALTGPRVRLIVVGDGDDRGRLEELAVAAGVASRVTFMGQTDDDTLIELYRSCRLMALPSLREGFGLVYLEAMTAGKAVIAARAGAVPELVRDGETGLLVPYQDREALAAAIRSLIDDPALASRLGDRGRLRAETEFGFERFAGRVVELLVSPHAA